MQGFQITFFTQQDRRHHDKPMAEWLLLAASQDYGQHRRIHSAHFFELADQT